MLLTQQRNGVAEAAAASSRCAEGSRTGLDRRGLPFDRCGRCFPPRRPSPLTLRTLRCVSWLAGELRTMLPCVHATVAWFMTSEVLVVVVGKRDRSGRGLVVGQGG